MNDRSHVELCIQWTQSVCLVSLCCRMCCGEKHGCWSASLFCPLADYKARSFVVTSAGSAYNDSAIEVNFNVMRSINSRLAY